MNTIVIGATQGLGLALVKKFLSGGHTVAAGVVERTTPASLEELQKDYGDKLMVFQADVTDEDEIQAGAELCAGWMGQADALINVAGVLLKGDRVNRLPQCDIAELRLSFEVNTIGAVIVVKHFYPIMRKDKKGRIMTITSEGVGVKNPGDWVPCYALSKTAATKISGMMNIVAEDVDFYSVHPGRMNTEMGKSTAQIEASESADGIYDMLTGKIAISRSDWYIDYKGDIMDA